MHGRPPEPFLRIVLDEAAHEALKRVARNDCGLWVPGFEPIDHRSGVGHETTIWEFHRGDLGCAGLFSQALPDFRRERDEAVRDLLVAEISFELSRVVGDGGAVDGEFFAGLDAFHELALP